jgi:hypothetical protein
MASAMAQDKDPGIKKNHAIADEANKATQRNKRY